MAWLQDVKWPEVEAYLKEKDIILLPIGSTEQHARHAPLGTDTIIASRLAEEAAAQANIMVAPPLWFGWSPHHMVLPGSISIRANVLQELVFDVIGSLAEHGFQRFVIVNGHRITNLPWMQLTAERAQSELKVRVQVFDPAYMQKEIAQTLGFGPVGHAEELETSQLMHFAPELVDLSKAVDWDPHETPLYQVDPRFPKDTLCYVPSTRDQMREIVKRTGGSTGHPTKSNAESGAKLHDHLVKRLVQVISQFE